LISLKIIWLFFLWLATESQGDILLEVGGLSIPLWVVEVAQEAT
jgi:hypothetical protein